VIELSDNELRFFWLTCDLFPTPESPLLQIISDRDELEDAEEVFLSLKEKGLLNDNDSGASSAVLDSLRPVSECDGRVVLRSGADETQVRNFYCSGDHSVEYRRDLDMHYFSPPRGEAALAAELAQYYKAATNAEMPPLRLSAGDYLVFAVFARDLRQSAPAENADDDAMSVDEVLAFFDEPETQYIRTPNDEAWQTSVRNLHDQGIVEPHGDGWILTKALRPIAQEIVADRQQSVMRFDFLDDNWLVREVSLYPSDNGAFRLGTDADGTVIIEELTQQTLAEVIADVVRTLPNLLNPRVPSMLRGAHARPS